MDMVGGSAPMSPCSSYNPSPCISYNPSPRASYNPSPTSSSFPSPMSSSFAAKANNINPDNSLIPWLKNLSSGSSSKLPHNLYIHTGSISAPVTPPLSSPTARSPRIKSYWDETAPGPSPVWGGSHNYSFQPSSTPTSPGRQTLPNSSEWLSGIRFPNGGPASPTFSLVASNPFGFREEASSSRMWTPGQSGTCSPAVAGPSDHTSDIPMADGFADEFAFGCNTTGLVKAWEGEKIHEECVSDDLELTLGSSRTREDMMFPLLQFLLFIAENGTRDS
ncbi:hypothetical protein GIB67_016670 [Kingdonia uniflora]|uniref:Protein BZR1 homolog n=1 Tax=Kingdonia uniflora TaxID=39325 RepID=A0A7J7ME96_9MAGN|nr:hypothetical protein GIB67_016670 [Kingdonia uniflora]